MADTANAGAAAAEQQSAEQNPTTDSAATEQQQETKTFTQEDLDRIVAERVAREKKRYADYEDLKAAKERLDAMEDENASEVEKAVKAARAEVEKELTERFNRERVADKIEVAAAGKFADVEDARLRLASRADEFVKDGTVDTEAIEKALADVLEKHPHLAAQQEKPKPPAPSRAGIGVSGDAKPAATVSPGYDRLRTAYGTGERK